MGSLHEGRGKAMSRPGIWGTSVAIKSLGTSRGAGAPSKPRRGPSPASGAGGRAPQGPACATNDWTGRGKVRARASDAVVEISIDGITTQARYYKTLVYEFFRKDFPIRPHYG